MAGSYAAIVDSKGRFAGAALVETGGDTEELARDCYGMVQWLADRLAAAAGGHKDEWIEQAALNSREGLAIGGTSDGDDEPDE
jgi:phage terminase Nu1 subunit (DNA packaging protein)